MLRMCTLQCGVSSKGTVRELYLSNILGVLLSQVLDRRAIHDQGDPGGPLGYASARLRSLYA